MENFNNVVLQDVFYHIDNLKTDFAKQKIEHNRNQFFVYAMNDFTNKIELIEQIVKSYDRQNFKLLTNKVNSVLFSDPELHCINVIIKKSKYLPQIDKSKTAIITHII